MRRMASPSNRFAALLGSLLLLTACDEALAPEDGRGGSVVQPAGSNYGDEHIGYKGSSLSNAASLAGDQTSLGAGAASARSVVGVSGVGGGGFAGGAAPPSGANGWSPGSLGGASGTPGGSSAPYQSVSADAGAARPMDAGPVDAAVWSDAE